MEHAEQFGAVVARLSERFHLDPLRVVSMLVMALGNVLFLTHLLEEAERLGNTNWAELFLTCWRTEREMWRQQAVYWKGSE
jgi:hypothetical protein